MAMTGNDPGPLGGSFEEFLAERGVREEVYRTALERVRAWQFEATRDRAKLGKNGRAGQEDEGQ
jgi:hypothetical protein